MDGPLVMRWEGDVMRPIGRFAKEADQRFIIGQTYALEEIKERSSASHAHYFAAVNDCWHSLPDDLAERYPTAEALRKFALIKAGYRDERSIVCGSKAEAHRVAAFVRPMDEFAVIAVSEAVVRVYTARSQSMRAMGRADFQASKDAVLGVLAEMLGTDTPALARAS